MFKRNHTGNKKQPQRLNSMNCPIFQKLKPLETVPNTQKKILDSDDGQNNDENYGSNFRTVNLESKLKMLSMIRKKTLQSDGMRSVSYNSDKRTDESDQKAHNKKSSVLKQRRKIVIIKMSYPNYKT